MHRIRNCIQGVIVKIKHQMPIKFRKRNVIVLQILVGAACTLLISKANAADVEKKIILTAGAVHDSNPAMDPVEKDPVWIYSLIPQFQLGITDEVNRWYLDAALLIQRNSNEKAISDQENPRVLVGWDRTYESGMFGISADYQETSARTAELNNTGTFTDFDNKQKTKILAAKWQHAIAPRWSVLTEGAYSDVTYSVTGALGDYTLGAIKSKLTYQNTEQLNTHVLLGYAQFSPDKNFKDTDLGRVAVGADYQMSEALTLSSSAGAYNLSGRQSETDWEANLKAGYVAGKMLYSAAIARDVVDSGVGFRKIDSARLTGQYNLSESNRIGAEYSFDQYKADRSIDVSKLNSQTIGAFYEHNLSAHWLARLAASHKKLDYTGNHPKGNVIGVTLVYDTLNF